MQKPKEDSIRDKCGESFDDLVPKSSIGVCRPRKGLDFIKTLPLQMWMSLKHAISQSVHCARHGSFSLTPCQLFFHFSFAPLRPIPGAVTLDKASHLRHLLTAMPAQSLESLRFVLTAQASRSEARTTLWMTQL